MNSFDIEEKDGLFYCTSHYFKDCTGVGETLEKACDDLSRKIVYVKDNEPKRFMEISLKRLKAEGGVGIYMPNGKL